jgi:hypothetical protein
MQLISLPTAGIIAFVGTLLYAIGDVFLLASKVNVDEYPKLKPFAKLLSDAEKMVVLSSNRMICVWNAFGVDWLLANLSRLEWSECLGCANNYQLVWKRINHRCFCSRHVLLHG